VNGAWNLAINATYTQHLVRINSLPTADRDSKDVVLEWSNTVRASARTTVTFGGLYNHIHGKEVFFGVTPSVTVADGRRHNGAVYSQVDYRLHPTLKVIGGFQANKQGALSLDVVPRAGLVWNPATHLNVKVLWGQAFRAPAINETVIVHPALIGNPLLKPEKVDSFDLAMTYQSDRFEGGVSYFRNRETNSIVLVGTAPPFTYANLGEATFHGVELHSKYYVDRRLYLVASTLYQQNRDGAGGQNVAPVANFAAKLGVSYETDFGLTGSVFDSYQSAVSAPPTLLNPPQDARHLVHARVRFDLSRYVRANGADALALVLHVNNLRNTEIWSRDVSAVFDTIPVDSGRVVYVGVEVALGGARANR
jgi:outer membrane receptor protein involved in Fe transport